MIPKQLFLNNEGQIKLREGIKMFSAAVKSTLGPAGRTVLMESESTSGGYTATKDGVTVANNLRFADSVHDMAAIMMRQAAQKTATLAGDGTTTSVVLTEAILDAYDKYCYEQDPMIDPKEVLKAYYETRLTIQSRDDAEQFHLELKRNLLPGISPIEITRGIHALSEEIIKALDEMAVPVTGNMLKHVATISANNDVELGELISDVFSKVDIVGVEDSKSSETYSEVVTGLKVDKGYVSRHFINDSKKQECVLKNARVLLYDKEITNLSRLEHVLTDLVKTDQPFLIIGTLSDAALSTMVQNVVKFGIKACVVTPPDFGYRQQEKMEDLATVLGGTFFSDAMGDDLQLITMEDLGYADKIVISESLTIITPQEDEETKLRHEKLKSDLGHMKDSVSDESNRRDVDSRLEAISGGYGTIYVGADTDFDRKEKKDRVEDAVCAVRAAKEEGVLPGGGIALLEAYSSIGVGLGENNDLVRKIMADSVNAPLIQMLQNSGLSDTQSVIDEVSGLSENHGYNIKTGEYGNMFEIGVIDPAKVTKSALRNAVSVATTILNTSCIVTNLRATE